MPLPDATKDQRIYQLLKNIDLGNLTFDQFQDAAETVFAEPEAEDTLRRIVLVNLARMSVAGDWTGLTSSGGGTQYAFDPIDASALPSTYEFFSPMDIYRTWSTTLVYTGLETKAAFFRFVAPKDGTMGSITVRTGSTQTGKDDVTIGIYQSSAGLPTTRIGDIDIDVNGGADLYSSSSWNTAPTLTAGSTYWIGFVTSGATFAALTTAHHDQFLSLGATHYPGTPYSNLYNNSGTDYDMPSTIDLSAIIPKYLPFFVWMYKYA